MSDYPERISISPVHRQKHDDDFYLVDRKAFPGKGTEYVRADIAYTRADLEAVLTVAAKIAYDHFVRTSQLGLGYAAHDAIRAIEIDAVLKKEQGE